MVSAVQHRVQPITGSISSSAPGIGGAPEAQVVTHRVLPTNQHLREGAEHQQCVNPILLEPFKTQQVTALKEAETVKLSPEEAAFVGAVGDIRLLDGRPLRISKETWNMTLGPNDTTASLPGTTATSSFIIDASSDLKVFTAFYKSPLFGLTLRSGSSFNSPEPGPVPPFNADKAMNVEGLDYEYVQ